MLAEALSKNLWEIQELPNLEIEKWKAFYTYRHSVQEFEEKKARSKQHG